jgi:hypothetical protein
MVNPYLQSGNLMMPRQLLPTESEVAGALRQQSMARQDRQIDEARAFEEKQAYIARKDAAQRSQQGIIANWMPKSSYGTERVVKGNLFESKNAKKQADFNEQAAKMLMTGKAQELDARMNEEKSRAADRLVNRLAMSNKVAKSAQRDYEGEKVKNTLKSVMSFVDKVNVDNYGDWVRWAKETGNIPESIFKKERDFVKMSPIEQKQYLSSLSGTSTDDKQLANIRKIQKQDEKYRKTQQNKMAKELYNIDKKYIKEFKREVAKRQKEEENYKFSASDVPGLIDRNKRMSRVKQYEEKLAYESMDLDQKIEAHYRQLNGQRTRAEIKAALLRRERGY